MLLYLCTWFDFKLDHLFSMRVIIFAITVGKGSGGKPGNKEVASSQPHRESISCFGQAAVFHLDRY